MSFGHSFILSLIGFEELRQASFKKREMLMNPVSHTTSRHLQTQGNYEEVNRQIRTTMSLIFGSEEKGRRAEKGAR
jgi:hypothetical protein